MKKRIVLAIVLAVLLAASAHAQTTDFFALVKSGTPQDVQAAISKGADIKARDTTHGWTALMWAASFNPNPEVITVLLKAGSDIKEQDGHGKTVLIAADDDGNPEVITVLLKAGSDINAHNSADVTALMYAAGENPNPEVILILLKAGADTKAKDGIGRTALDYAQNNLTLNETDALKKLEEASKQGSGFLRPLMRYCLAPPRGGAKSIIELVFDALHPEGRGSGLRPAQASLFVLPWVDLKQFNPDAEKT